MSKKKSRISTLAGDILFWFTYGIAIGISYFMSESISVNGFIPTDTALNILKALVDVNIALLAFWGLILVFSLSSLRQRKGTVERERYELAIAKDRLALEREIKLTNGKKRSVVKAFIDIEQRYRERATELDTEFKQLAKQISILIIGAFGTMVFLLGGLLQSVTAMGKIGSQGLYFPEIVYCFVVMLMSVFLMFTALWSSRPKYEKEILRESFVKGWNKFREELREAWVKSRKESKERSAYWQKVFAKKLGPLRRKMESIGERARQKRKAKSK